jgi:hypothetical protein
MAGEQDHDALADALAAVVTAIAALEQAKEALRRAGVSPPDRKDVEDEYDGESDDAVEAEYDEAEGYSAGTDTDDGGYG